MRCRSFASALVLGLATVVASSCLSGASFADDSKPAAPPASPVAPEGGEMQGPPQPRPAISDAYLKSLVGTWDLAIHTGQGPDLKGTSTTRLALDGTAVIEEMDDGAAFAGMGVQYVAADGKGLNLWWFDSMGDGGVWAWKGTLVDGGYDLAGDAPDGGKATGTMRKKGDGHVYEMKMAGASAMTITYTKAAKPAAAAPIARDKGPKSAMVDMCLGDWTVAGMTVIDAVKMEIKHEGTSSFRLGVGGAYLIQDYEIKSDMEHSFALGVMSFGADGKSMRLWSFGNTMDVPLEVPGTVDGTTYKGKLEKTPFGGQFELSIAKKGEAIESAASIVIPIGKVLVSETYTRKK